VQLYRYFVSQSSEFCRHNLCVSSQLVFIVVVVVVVVYFVIDLVRKLLDTPSYVFTAVKTSNLASLHLLMMENVHIRRMIYWYGTSTNIHKQVPPPQAPFTSVVG
jgi:hypothetical protein